MMQAEKIKSPMRIEHGRLIAEVSLPGFKKDEIKVEPLYDGVQISAFRERTDDEKPWPNQQSIRSYWRFFNLPEAARREGLKYKFRHGKLTISMPYDEEDDDDEEEEGRPVRAQRSEQREEADWEPDIPGYWPRYRHMR